MRRRQTAEYDVVGVERNTTGCTRELRYTIIKLTCFT